MIVGVTTRGQKRFLAIADGVREATQSRLSHIHASMCCQSTGREVLLSLKSRGMNAPKLADLPLLSYDFGSFYANLEQLRSTSFMPGSGGGWTVPLLVVEDRR